MSFNLDKLGDTQIIYSIGAISEKEGLNPEELFLAIEFELAQEAGSRQYGDKRISVYIDRKTGSISAEKRSLVVDDSEFKEKLESFVENSDDQDPVIHVRNKFDDLIMLSNAIKRYEGVKSGDIITDRLPGVSSDYLIARSMKPRIEKVVNILIRTKQYNDYKSRVNDIVTGVVERCEFRHEKRNMIVNINGVDTILPFSGLIKGETFRSGERIKALVEKVEFSTYKHQIILSRTSDDFLMQLITQQVPEVYDGVIELKKVVREPGSRAKIAVYSSDKNIDPVGACVGIRGGRINMISAELNGEKIDVVEYSNDPAVFLVNSIKSIKTTKVTVNNDDSQIDLVAPDESLSLIVGRKGQNIRLISRLIGWRINLLAESDVSKKRMDEFLSGTSHFINTLNVEEVIAQLLVTEGFKRVEEVVDASVESLSRIDGFDNEIATELHRRAMQYINDEEEKSNELIENYSVNKDFLMFLPSDYETKKKILMHDIKNIEKIAELSLDELINIIGDKANKDVLSNLIIDARKKVGWIK